MTTITREQAIDKLRRRLSEASDENHSVCQVAGHAGIFCHGFSQWSFDELKRRYWWLAERRPNVTREELERLANAWQVARQEVFGTKLACDTQSIEHDTCTGWDEFDDATLARFVKELCGDVVEVRSGSPA
jgi:hypothetical protein